MCLRIDLSYAAVWIFIHNLKRSASVGGFLVSQNIDFTYVVVCTSVHTTLTRSVIKRKTHFLFATFARSVVDKCGGRWEEVVYNVRVVGDSGIL
jgi:hypothetical protein